MSPSAPARVACAAPSFVTQAATRTLQDWLAYFDPAAVLLTGDEPAPRAASRLRRHLDADIRLFRPASATGNSDPDHLAGVQVVVAPTTATLERLHEYEEDQLNPDTPTFVFSDLLALDVDTTTLTTTLVGREEYLTALDPDRLDGTYIHIATRLPAEYRREWAGLTVVGGGQEAGVGGTPLVALDCRNDGRVLTRSLTRSQLGLRALDRVGETRAERLREAGFVTRTDVATAPPNALADLSGIGRKTAERIRQSARAIADETIVRTSNEPLPAGDPVYIDIETDGLNPTITWLVGVLDGTADDGTYMAFLQRDPDAPGRAIADFMAWYTANASHRPLVAYRGWDFDFAVVHDHIVEYCPDYADDWTNTYRFDPYRWAIEKDNAILPGRTNTLEDVASALGYDRADTGLTGAAVARVYQRWMADQSQANEPDWDRFRTYCEDDVRGLAVLYEALADSDRLATTTDRRTDTTTQGSLSDW